jgi:hypothetical protein
MDNKDALQIKIDEAKANLPPETNDAINAVDWRATILTLREKRGYSFEQLEDLETETELMLYGLITTEEYPKEIENRLKISKNEATELVNELNDLIFMKIRGELIKNSGEKREIPETKKEEQINTEILKSAKIEITPEKPRMEVKTDAIENVLPASNREEMLSNIENPDSIVSKTETPKPLMTAQKLSGTFQMPKAKTEYTLPSLNKDKTATPIVATPTTPSTPETGAAKPKVDPYREIPE